MLPQLFDDVTMFQKWFGKKKQQPVKKLKGRRGGRNDSSPITEEGLSVEEAATVTQRLHDVMRPFILRRTKGEVCCISHVILAP